MDSSVEQLVIETQRLWKGHQPIASSFWSEPVWHKGEDLTEEGIDEWKRALCALDSKIDALKSQKQLSVISEVVLDELNRFIQEQKLKYTHQRIYEKRASAILQLVAFSLLPFFLKSGLAHTMSEALEYRLNNCTKWLEQGEQRLKQNKLTYTETDKKVIKHILNTLKNWEHIDLEAGGLLLNRLKGWLDYPVQHTSHGTNIHLKWYLNEIYQIRYSLDKLVSLLFQKLKAEITNYNAITEIKTHNTAETETEFQIKLMDSVKRVRTHIQGNFIENVSPEANILPAPKIILPFINDALYLSPHFVGEPIDSAGYFIYNISYLGNTKSDQLITELACVYAHEISPGHHEHITRGYKSPLAKLFEITRSPIGFEGWATYGEQIITSPEHLLINKERTVTFHRIRRMYFALSLLTDIYKKNVQRMGLDRLLKSLPENEYHTLQNLPFRPNWQLLTYAVGLIETEKALNDIATLSNRKRDKFVYESYLRWGPLYPQSVVNLIKSNLD